MRPTLRFLGVVLAIWAGIAGLGFVASLTFPGPLVGSTVVVSIGSILLGAALLAGSGGKSEQTSRAAYVTSGTGGTLAWGRLTESETQAPKYYTPSGVPPKTMIKPPGKFWLTSWSFGAAVVVAGLASLILAILFYPLLV